MLSFAGNGYLSQEPRKGASLTWGSHTWLVRLSRIWKNRQELISKGVVKYILEGQAVRSIQNMNVSVQPRIPRKKGVYLSLV